MRSVPPSALKDLSVSIAKRKIFLCFHVLYEISSLRYLRRLEKGGACYLRDSGDNDNDDVSDAEESSASSTTQSTPLSPLNHLSNSTLSAHLPQNR